MAGRGRPKSEVLLADEERATLERWARRPKSAQRLAQRCRIVLCCRGGKVRYRGGAPVGYVARNGEQVAPEVHRLWSRRAH